MNTSTVTVGIPTYNRPDQLSRALELISNQTYRNLQIIVSDNASEDPRVAEVVQEHMRTDPRISYHRHEKNLGSTANFCSLIDKATGEFFLWAADDDRWEPFFIERCVEALERDPSLGLCQMEGRYETAEGLFEFFPEGSGFNNFSSSSPYERVANLIGNNFDKLIYGVYRTGFLNYQGRPVMKWVGPTMNEIPLFILIAAQANIRVLSEVGMYKVASKTTCEQARWEQVGGKYPVPIPWLAHLRSLWPTHAYHSGVIREVCAAIDSVFSDGGQAKALRDLAARKIRRHEFYMAIRWKRRPRQSA
jgi:glycosyltransferase involved in cell wall biosynthesis